MYFLLKLALWIFCFRFALKGRVEQKRWYQLALAIGFALLTLPDETYLGWRKALAVLIYIVICPFFLHWFLAIESIFKSLLVFAVATLFVFFAMPWLVNF